MSFKEGLANAWNKVPAPVRNYRPGRGLAWGCGTPVVAVVGLTSCMFLSSVCQPTSLGNETPKFNDPGVEKDLDLYSQPVWMVKDNQILICVANAANLRYSAPNFPEQIIVESAIEEYRIIVDDVPGSRITVIDAPSKPFFQTWRYPWRGFKGTPSCRQFSYNPKVIYSDKAADKVIHEYASRENISLDGSVLYMPSKPFSPK